MRIEESSAYQIIDRVEKFSDEIQLKVADFVIEQIRASGESPVPYFLVSKNFSRIYEDAYSKNLVGALLQIPLVPAMVRGVKGSVQCRRTIVAKVDDQRLINRMIQELLLNKKDTLSELEKCREKFDHIKCFLEAGCNPKIALYVVLHLLDFNSDAHIALSDQIIELIDCLLRYGADANGDSKRTAPLYLAVEQIPYVKEGQEFQMKLIRLMCQRGAEPERSSKVGKKNISALRYAKKHYPYAAKILLESQKGKRTL